MVVPVDTEGTGVVRFLSEQLMPVLATIKYAVEVVVVDDGSSDQTVEKVKEWFSSYNGKGGGVELRLLAMTRNFGKEVALSAGLAEAKGDAVVMIDADGQHPAEVIPEMVERWEKGAVIVTAVRKHDSTKHRLGSRVYYRLMRMLGNRNLVVGAMDFRLLDREVVDEFNLLTERNRLARGLIDWLGYPQEYIMVKTRGRLAGKPSYSFRKLAGLAFDSMVSSSRTPLVVFGYIGALITVVSAVFGLFILVEQ